MKNLHLYCASPKQFYFFEQRLLNRTNDYIAVLPVNRAVRILKQRLLEASVSGALLDPNIFTFDRLLLKLYAAQTGAKRVLSAGMLQILIESLLEKTTGSLPYFLKNKQITSGLVRKVSEAVSELRRFGYDSAGFSQIKIDEKNTQPLKYSDFEVLLKALDDALGAQLIDEPFAKHTAAARLTEETFRIQFPQVKEIFISGYGLFTPAMFTFIEKLSAWMPLHIKLEYSAENPALFQHTHKAYLRLKTMGAQEHNTMAQSVFANTLFRRATARAPKSDQKTRVFVQAVQDRRGEVEYIAAKIRQFYQTNKIAPARIALTFANLEQYVPILRQVFRRFHIPFNLSTGFALNQSPLIKLFLQPLRLAASGCEWEQIMGFLNNPLLPLRAIEFTRLNALLAEQRRTRLTPGWAEYLFKSAAFMRLKAEEQKEIREQAGLINETLDLLCAFPKQAAVTEFRQVFIKLLSDLKLLRWYEIPNAHLSERQKEMEFRALNRFMKVLDQVVWMAARVTDDKSITLSRFIQYLDSAGEDALYNLTEWQGYGVQIMPRLEVQALEADVLFLGGLNDGVFPRASTKDVFFSDSVREKMGLAAAEELLSQDRFIFYSLLDASSKKLILTYPKYEEERALVPSTFLSDLSEVSTVHREETPPEPDFTLNESRLYENLGRHIQQFKFEQAQRELRLLSALRGNSAALFKDLFRKTILTSRRMFSADFGPYEGVLSAHTEIARGLTKRYQNREWSASRLETYAFCPMRYFFEYILTVEEWRAAEADLTSLERGNAVHDILYAFYKQLKEKEEQARPRSNRNLLFRIAEEVFARLPFSGFFWELEKKKYFGYPNRPGLLDAFLETDQAHIDEDGFTPTYFEYEFGKATGKEIVLKDDTTTLKLRGRIDRIDTKGGRQAEIIDYKTGTGAANKSPKETLKGLSVQLPLYMLALEQARPELEVNSAAYYVVKDAEHCERKIFLADAPSFGFEQGKKMAFLPNNYLKDEAGNRLHLDDLLGISLQKTLENIQALQRGVFRHTGEPENKYCTHYCPYKRVCQKQTGKILKADAENQTEQK